MATLLLVRHARAGTRGQGPEDLARPLDARGIDQAAALPDRLVPLLVPRAGRPDAVPLIAASPARRCIDTVAPLASVLGTTVTVDGALVEGSDVRVLHARLADLDRPTVWASHGDVIPELLTMLARRGLDLGDAPRCQKGSTWVVTVEGGEAVAARYLPPLG